MEQRSLTRERGGVSSLGRGWTWRARFRRYLGGALLALLSAVVAVSAYFWHLHSLVSVSTDNSYVVGNITPVSSEIGGQIVALYTDDNRLVEAGSPLAQIDPVPYQIAVDQAVADLAQARADAQAARLTVEQTEQDRSSASPGGAGESLGIRADAA